MQRNHATTITSVRSDCNCVVVVTFPTRNKLNFYDIEKVFLLCPPFIILPVCRLSPLPSKPKRERAFYILRYPLNVCCINYLLSKYTRCA